MKIVYLGNRTHAFCTEVHIAADATAAGHDVVFVQEPHGGADLSFLDQLEQTCVNESPDLFLFTRTWGLPPEATALWRRLEARGIITASYHLDLYVGLARQARVGGDSFWTTQHVFTPDGDPASEAWFAAHGINHHWTPPAVVSTGCYTGEFDARFDYDVVFVGSEKYHPEWPWRPKLIGWLRERYGDRFKKFPVDDVAVRENDLNNLYATARVVVGDSLNLPGRSKYWSDRLVETIGRGGFLIFPTIDGLYDEGFRDGEHLRLYDHGDLEGIGQLVDHYLDHPDEARRIAQQGQQFVRDHHTYQHRIRYVMDTIAGTALASQPGPEPEVEAPPAPKALIKLELGSGYHPTPGFVHLDLNPNAPDVDIVASFHPLPMIDDATVSELRAVDVLEHWTYQQTDQLLAEWARIMTPGGRAYIQVPDCDTIMRWYVNEPGRLVGRIPKNLPDTPISGAQWRILGGHLDGVYAKAEDGDDFRWNAHYSMWSPKSLAVALDKAGFDIESMEINPHPNILCWAVRR